MMRVCKSGARRPSRRGALLRLMAALCLPVFAAVSLTGCGSGMDKDSLYSFETREQIMAAEEAEDGMADAFASQLCVVTDEGAFDQSLVDAEAAAVFSVDDLSVVYSKNAFERLYPASITKVMTAILALKEGDLSDRVTVTDAAVITETGASLANVKPGDELTLEQLLYGLMLPSGNDAANAIAVHLAGSVDAFADMMNRETLALGATGTHFTNPSGLSNADHYTTAYDLYLIFNEAMKYSEFREIIATPSYTANYTDGSGQAVSQTWMASNWFMNGERQMPSGLTALGGKTGTTAAAGYCLIMASQADNGSEYISVVLKAGSRPLLYDNMTNIVSKIVD